MCGRFTLRTPLSVLARQFRFELDEAIAATARYNIAPTQDVLAVRSNEVGRRELVALHWGLIPPWSKDAKLAYSTINARADTIGTKPAFKTAFLKRRCLILADGYYEWRREGKAKLPVLYEVNGGEPFAFAGIWESWRGPPGASGASLESCTIITTGANELAAEVHDRMPVILGENEYDRWLDPTNQRADGLRFLLEPYPADHMTARPVSTFVNNARNEGPNCLMNSL